MEWYYTGLLLFAILIGYLVIGVPVAFSLGLAGITGVYLFLSPKLIFQLARISFDVASTQLFVVAPLFILMAGVVSQSDIAEKTFTAATKWLNWMPGSLGVSTVAAATMFSAISGSSPATAAAIGYTAVPEMLRHGYDKRFAAGIVAAGGTLGILIPPSIVMIIYGIITETSIGALFAAGIVPGLVFSGLLMCYVMFRSRNQSRNESDAIVTWSDRFHSLPGIWPIILLFCIVMGAIYTGIATPTEAAGFGATAGLFLTLWRKGMGWTGLNIVLLRTAQTTAMLLLLIICGTFFGFVISQLGIAQDMVDALVRANVSPWTVLLGYIGTLLVLGCLMDPASMMVITLPLAFPILHKLGFDAVWIGVLVTVAVEIGMITPPVGLNLFILQGVVPKDINSMDIALGALPFVFVLLLGLALLLLFPDIVLWLPRSLG